MPLEYTFWLIPGEPFKSQLRAIINNLAREFSAPEFDPHLTFYWPQESSVAEACDIAKKIAARFSAFEIDVQGLDQSSLYSKTFFIQFQQSATANRMFEMARDMSAVPSGYALDPHVSLLYKHMDEGTRQEMCRRSIVPTGAYKFDEVWAVEFESPWSEKSAREYRVLARHGLNLSS